MASIKLIHSLKSYMSQERKKKTVLWVDSVFLNHIQSSFVE